MAESRKRWDWKNEDAKAALDKYEGIVRMTARKLRHAMAVGLAMDFDDLCAEGRVAVLEALESYAGFGVDERSWVRMRVRQRMIDAIRRLDLRSRDEFRLAARHSAGEVLTDDENERSRAVHARRAVSMDAVYGDAEPLSMRLRDSMIPSAEHCAEASTQHDLLVGALKKIPARQREAIELSVFEGMALREIGRRMGITESRVCQLQKRAVEHLKKVVLEESSLSAA
jgi:RNA polymerase sigma factor for flagellar operon FliA